MNKKPKLLFVLNVDWFLISHRLPIALEAQKQGYEVHVACGITDKRDELESYGFVVHPLRMRRGWAGIMRETSAFAQLFCLLMKLRPDLLHLITVKPVLFGGVAARLARVRHVVAAIAGLGFISTASDRGASIKRVFVAMVYKIALQRKSVEIICQNPEDLSYIKRIVKLPSKQFHLLRGSGVDLSKFTVSPLPNGIPVIVMACRLLVDKGVWEFVGAANLLRQRGIQARFLLAGATDPHNPTSLSNIDLVMIKEKGLVELLGHRSDMEKLFAGANIVTLPSYYGEGLPKVLIEAAACGRAVITTDMPGCRDAIEPGVTGLLIPPRDAKALADAIGQLIEDPAKCQSLGKAGRTLAEREFDIRKIVQEHMGIYAQLIS